MTSRLVVIQSSACWIGPCVQRTPLGVRRLASARAHPASGWLWWAHSSAAGGWRLVGTQHCTWLWWAHSSGDLPAAGLHPVHMCLLKLMCNLTASACSRACCVGSHCCCCSCSMARLPHHPSISTGQQAFTHTCPKPDTHVQAPSQTLKAPKHLPDAQAHICSCYYTHSLTPYAMSLRCTQPGCSTDADPRTYPAHGLACSPGLWRTGERSRGVAHQPQLGMGIWEHGHQCHMHCMRLHHTQHSACAGARPTWRIPLGGTPG